MLIHWIWLAHRAGVSDRMKQILLEAFSDPEDIYCSDSYAHLEGLSEAAVEGLMDKSLAGAEAGNAGILSESIDGGVLDGGHLSGGGNSGKCCLAITCLVDGNIHNDSVLENFVKTRAHSTTGLHKKQEHKET